MAEPSKDAFDPDATVRQPVAEPDPEATVRMPAAQPDADSTIRGPLFDPEATVNSAADPEATVRIPSPGKLRRNPFAPSASPASLHTSLASLGGINPLVELANAVLGAVPQIRHALRHPDPARLRAMLRDQIEAFEGAARSGNVAEATLKTSVDALCALLDDSAGSTPWGAEWKRNGVGKDLGREGAENGALARTLESVAADAGADPTLVEFLYVCLALGFEGRRDFDPIREKLYAVAARHRPRPAGLSERWRSEPMPEPDFLLEPAADTPAAAPVAEPTPVAGPPPAPEPEPDSTPAPIPKPVSSFSPKPGEIRYEAPAPRMPKTVVLRIGLGIAAFLVVGFILVLRLIEDDVVVDPKTKSRSAATQASSASAPAAVQASASAELARALEKHPVAISESAGRVTLTLRSQNQFGSGAEGVNATLQPILRAIAQALDKVPGAITVTGYSDAVPVRASGRHASNQALSLKRAEAAAAVMAISLSDPRRIKAEGKGDVDPVAPNDTPENRARNRRVVISVGPSS